MNPPSRHGPRPASVTWARTGLSQDVRGRRRRCLAAMLVRTACVAVMAITWNRRPAPAVRAQAGGLVIPCVAVVAARAGRGRQRGTRPVPAPVAAREESAARVPLEPTLIPPPEHRTAA
ncbi:DUF3099 domain-containing protein [Streptomyces sp. NBC_00015]|uniref:DUF3099 domain-containing protein n=1 Tax=unclassified Streptomyces TaxID=2593676 RepID=UPI002252BB4E|nr:DUF3099 domain-containing protein [Streptomyces sp. NBC_00103]MCX5372756.1 DUF3099 domain-containing protein [Streptomyces sp. NBC_00103]